MSASGGILANMTRFGIDAATALRLIRDGADGGRRHQLVAPSALRAEVLALIYRDVHAHRITQAEGRRQLEALARLKIRLLGDRVSRATAWKIAEQLGWKEIGAAEYLAVASLQADALITQDAEIAEAAEGIVPIASYMDLTG